MIKTQVRFIISKDRRSKPIRPSYRQGAWCLQPCSNQIWWRIHWIESTYPTSHRMTSMVFFVLFTRAEWNYVKAMRHLFLPQPISIWFHCSSSPNVRNSSSTICTCTVATKVVPYSTAYKTSGTVGIGPFLKTVFSNKSIHRWFLSFVNEQLQ